jgi:amidophosphoribosyltransferase
MPKQNTRPRSVRYKLTPQRTEIEGKKVLVVDDSIVRGTTSREIIKMIREFNAKEIYLASSCPPIKHPCFYGIDMPSHDELIAATHTEDDIRKFIGVDKLLYQTQEDLVEAITRRGDHHIHRPCMACMDGDYICGKIDKDKSQAMAQVRLKEKS